MGRSNLAEEGIRFAEFVAMGEGCSREPVPSRRDSLYLGAFTRHFRAGLSHAAATRLLPQDDANPFAGGDVLTVGRNDDVAIRSRPGGDGCAAVTARLLRREVLYGHAETT